MAIRSPDIAVDKNDQLEKFEGFCLRQETVRPVFDLKGSDSGSVGMTDKRLIYYDYDKTFPGKKRTWISIPHNHIISVCSEDDRRIFAKSGFFIGDRPHNPGHENGPQGLRVRGRNKDHSTVMKHVLSE